MTHILFLSKKCIYLLYALFLLPEISFSQDKPVTCQDIHHGIFYSYPKNTSDEYAEKIEGQNESDKNLKSGDTVQFRIKWGRDCSFSEKYVAGNTKMSLQTRALLEENTFVEKITNITNDYFTFTTYINKMPDIPIGDDTIWFHPQLHPTNSPLFTTIANSALLRQKHFSDTSRYAVLYLYRPGKLSNFLNLYPVYMDNIEMGIAENNSGYIFKILKEGSFEIKGTLFNQSASIMLPVSFGHIYYVKTRVHWGATERATHVEMMVADPKKGAAEFDKVKRKF
ncbi:MAG: hypothetical protein EPN39_06430 [Chitinophagaceae bacterium]|nr:MAG: hypothetical protein EPN39_06430 [Chitinophagaceae bacterium]